MKKLFLILALLVPAFAWAQTNTTMIGGLPPASALTGGELVPLSQNGITSQATVSQIVSSVPSGGPVDLGTSTVATNPSISGDLTSGLYTAGAAKVDVAISSSKIVEWVTTGEVITGTLAASGHVTFEGVTSAGATGTSNLVFSNSPTFVTPVLGAAAATTINGVTIPSTTDTVALLGTEQSFTKNQAVTPVTVTISTVTFTPAFANSNSFNIQLVHASCPCTIANPSGTIVPGADIVIAVQQSSSGSDTVGTWGSEYKFSGGTAPTLSTSANAIDLIPCHAWSTTDLLCSSVGNFAP